MEYNLYLNIKYSLKKYLAKLYEIIIHKNTHLKEKIMSKIAVNLFWEDVSLNLKKQTVKWNKLINKIITN